MNDACPPVTLCIVNYNGETHLERAIQGLRSQRFRFAEVIVVDNASTDGSLALIERSCPEARVVRLAENRGPGAARNAGFVASSHDLILFLDNDVELTPDAAGELLQHVRRHPDTFIVAPRIIHADETGTVQCDGADCHWLGLMTIRNANTSMSIPAVPSRMTSMASMCFLINRARWGGGPLFDESFIFNLEDHDLGVRSCLLGHQLWVHPGALVRHGSGTPGLSYRGQATPSETRIFCLVRNRWLVLAKCFSGRTLVVLKPALLCFEIMQLTWLTLDGKGSVWWRALRSFVQQYPALRHERARLQASRRVSDREILKDAALPLTAYARRGGLATRAIEVADSLLRGYWRVARRWIG